MYVPSNYGNKRIGATAIISVDNSKNLYEGGSICNENPFITPSTNALGFNAIYQTKVLSVAVIMVHETLFYLSKL